MLQNTFTQLITSLKKIAADNKKFLPPPQPLQIHSVFHFSSTKPTTTLTKASQGCAEDKSSDYFSPYCPFWHQNIHIHIFIHIFLYTYTYIFNSVYMCVYIDMHIYALLCTVPDVLQKQFWEQSIGHPPRKLFRCRRWQHHTSFVPWQWCQFLCPLPRIAMWYPNAAASTWEGKMTSLASDQFAFWDAPSIAATDRPVSPGKL